MGKCESQTFSNFNEECLQALLRRVQAEGVGTAPGAGGSRNGTASRAGFEIAWSYDPDTETLVVQCTSSPFYAPCSVVQAQIQRWIEACYESSPRSTPPA